MSRKKCSGQLRGYNGPIFTKNMALLNTLFNRLEINSTKMPNVRLLNEISGVIKGYEGFKKVAASDGYSWAFVLKFLVKVKTEEGEVLIAIPFLNGKDCGGGVWLDRSIAGYTKGFIASYGVAVETITGELIREIKRAIALFNARGG